MKRSFLALLLVGSFLALSMFSACRSDDMPAPISDFLVIDLEQEAANFNVRTSVYEKGSFRSRDTVPLDLNEDGIDDLRIFYRHFNAVSGYYGEGLSFEILHEDLGFIGDVRADSIIHFQVFDEENNRYCIQKAVNEISSTIRVDSILFVEQLSALHPRLLSLEDTIFFDETFQYATNGLLLDTELDYVDFGIFCRSIQYELGPWETYQGHGFLAYRLVSSSEEYFGWIELTTEYALLSINSIATVQLE